MPRYERLNQGGGLTPAPIGGAGGGVSGINAFAQSLLRRSQDEQGNENLADQIAGEKAGTQRAASGLPYEQDMDKSVHFNRASRDNWLQQKFSMADGQLDMLKEAAEQDGFDVSGQVDALKIFDEKVAELHKGEKGPLVQQFMLNRAAQYRLDITTLFDTRNREEDRASEQASKVHNVRRAAGRINLTNMVEQVDYIDTTIYRIQNPDVRLQVQSNASTWIRGSFRNSLRALESKYNPDVIPSDKRDSIYIDIDKFVQLGNKIAPDGSPVLSEAEQTILANELKSLAAKKHIVAEQAEFFEANADPSISPDITRANASAFVDALEKRLSAQYNAGPQESNDNLADAARAEQHQRDASTWASIEDPQVSISDLKRIIPRFRDPISSGAEPAGALIELAQNIMATPDDFGRNEQSMAHAFLLYANPQTRNAMMRALLDASDEEADDDYYRDLHYALTGTTDGVDFAKYGYDQVRSIVVSDDVEVGMRLSGQEYAPAMLPSKSQIEAAESPEQAIMPFIAAVKAREGLVKSGRLLTTQENLHFVRTVSLMNKNERDMLVALLTEAEISAEAIANSLGRDDASDYVVGSMMMNLAGAALPINEDAYNELAALPQERSGIVLNMQLHNTGRAARLLGRNQFIAYLANTTMQADQQGANLTVAERIKGFKETNLIALGHGYTLRPVINNATWGNAAIDDEDAIDNMPARAFASVPSSATSDADMAPLTERRINYIKEQLIDGGYNLRLIDVSGSGYNGAIYTYSIEDADGTLQGDGQGRHVLRFDRAVSDELTKIIERPPEKEVQRWGNPYHVESDESGAPLNLNRL